MRTRELDALYLRAPRLNQFNILRLLAEDSGTTQAELARRCHLSVAMVNNYMKDLRSAGLLEYRRRGSQKVSYEVTDEGSAEAEKLEHDLIDELAQHFAEAKDRIRRHILAHAPGPLKCVVLLGNGSLAELACHALESSGVRVLGVADGQSSGNDYCGRTRMDFSRASQLRPDAVVVGECRATPLVNGFLRALAQRGVPIICINGLTWPQTAEAGHGRPALLHSPI